MMWHVWRQSLERLQHDLEAIFGRRLQSLVAYDAHFGLETGADPPSDSKSGSRTADVHAMVIVDTLTFADLSACAAQADGWHEEHLAVPLLLTAAEFARSLDAFPLEFTGIASHHLLVTGADPFQGVVIERDDLRRACETQAKSHLIHLREGFVEARAQAASVARLIAASAASFRAILVNLAHLDGVAARSREALVHHAAERIGVPAALVDRVLALQGPDDLDASEALRVYTGYLDAVERLAALVDGWKA